MKVDYIIVGIGLAGISFCEQLKANNKSFIVFDDISQKSSTVAGGLYNPVVLKRFTPVWQSEVQIELALQMYENIEKRLNITLDYKIPVYRKFASLEEQNNWFAASENPLLSKCLSEAIIKNKNEGISAPFGFGKVNGTGRINTSQLIESYKSELRNINSFIEERLNYNNLEIYNKSIRYGDFEASHIVFSEGFGVKNNPFFKELPLVPTKGELIKIHAPNLKIDYVLKGPVFLIPLEDDLYIVGATYEWKDISNKISLKAKETLLQKLNTMITCDYKVVDQVAGIRPTVKDRRPLVGTHKTYKNIHVLNGLGTRGVMIGPYVAKQLFEFIEFEKPLDKEINITRY